MISLSLVCLALIAFCAYRERAIVRERGELLQRIQAPETAVIEHAREERPPTPKVGFEDDAAFAAVKEMSNGRG